MCTSPVFLILMQNGQDFTILHYTYVQESFILNSAHERYFSPMQWFPTYNAPNNYVRRVDVCLGRGDYRILKPYLHRIPQEGKNREIISLIVGHHLLIVNCLSSTVSTQELILIRKG